MSRFKSCRCREPLYDEVRDGNDKVLALICRRCTLPHESRCRVCMEWFKELGQHLARSECGEFDKKGMWWTPDRPPIADLPQVRQQEQTSMFKDQ